MLELLQPILLVYALVLVGLDVVDFVSSAGKPEDIGAPVVVLCMVALGAKAALVVLMLSCLSVIIIVRSVPLRVVAYRYLARMVCLALMSVAGLVLDLSQHRLAGFIAVLVASLAFVALSRVSDDYAHRLQLGRRWVLESDLTSEWQTLAAKVSIALLGVTVVGMIGSWSILLVVVLLLMTRQAVIMLSTVREAYRGVAEAVIRATELEGSVDGGHLERVASTAVAVALQCGAGRQRTEAVYYASLFHHLVLESHAEVFEVLRDVHFLEPSLPILKLLDNPSTDVEDESSVIDALVVALVDEHDQGRPSDSARILRQRLPKGTVDKVSRCLESELVTC